jgi:hypothetical protein
MALKLEQSQLKSKNKPKRWRKATKEHQDDAEKPLRVLSKTKDIIPVRYRTYFPNQCSESFTFWYGSGTLFQTDEILGNPCQFGLHYGGYLGG